MLYPLCAFPNCSGKRSFCPLATIIGVREHSKVKRFFLYLRGLSDHWNRSDVGREIEHLSWFWLLRAQRTVSVMRKWMLMSWKSKVKNVPSRVEHFKHTIVYEMTFELFIDYQRSAKRKTFHNKFMFFHSKQEVINYIRTLKKTFPELVFCVTSSILWYPS